MLDESRKAELDHRWILNGIRTAHEQAYQEGRRQGLKQSELFGGIQICQSLLGVPVETDAELTRYSMADLETKRDMLRQQLYTRLNREHQVSSEMPKVAGSL